VELCRQRHRIRTLRQGFVAAVTDLEQVGDVFLGGPLAHHRDDAEFEDLSRLGDLLVGQLGQRQQVDDALAEAGAGGGGDECAAAGPDLDGDHAVGLEAAQRFADGHPADAELFAQIPFRRQPVTRFERTVANQQFDLIDDHL
jgi:hypothetical protein